MTRRTRTHPVLSTRLRSLAAGLPEPARLAIKVAVNHRGQRSRNSALLAQILADRFAARLTPSGAATQSETLVRQYELTVPFSHYLAYLWFRTTLRSSPPNDRGSRSLFYRLASALTPALLSDAGHAKFYVPTSDWIGHHIFTTGNFEEWHLARVIQVLSSRGIQDFSRRVFVDIGANLGTSSITALLNHGFGGALAIEPNPKIFQLLQANILINDLGNRIRALNLALSDAPGEIRLEIDAQNAGDARIRLGGDETLPGAAGLHRENTRATVTVPASTFDSLVKSGEVDLDHVGLVWMDAQGHESHIFEGAQMLLTSGTPVLTEFWPYGLMRARGLDQFERIVAENYSHFVDVRALDARGEVRFRPAPEIVSLKAEYQPRHGHEHTDVLLLRL